MKTSELKATLRERLTGDAAIDAFCRQHFGVPVTMLRAFDDNAPPDKTSCPWLYLELMTAHRSTLNREVRHTFSLVTTVWRDPSGADDDAEDLASDLRELVEAAIMAPGLGKVETGEDVFCTSEDGFADNLSTITITNR